jgi:hypothetical protein
MDCIEPRIRKIELVFTGLAFFSVVASGSNPSTIFYDSKDNTFFKQKSKAIV